MTRFNFSSISKTASTRNSFAWGKLNTYVNNLHGSASALLFGAILLICSIAVGCSSDKPKPATSISETPVSPSPTTVANMSTPPVETAAAKPAPKKIVHRRPSTLTYADQTSGVSFQYPRKYDLKTGDDAGKLVSSIPLPMNFVQPGGVVLAAVELPGTTYNANDLAAAFFNVSVNKAVTAEQCEEFLALQNQATTPSNASASGNSPTPSASSTPTDSSASADPSVQAAAQSSKLILGDMELRGMEAVTGEGIRQSDAKYFHVFENSACYEFAMNVTTAAPESQLALKHVDREKAFQQLEKLLATVKINPVATPEVAASAPASPVVPAATSETPAQ
jgi:hypothetical protein